LYCPNNFGPKKYFSQQLLLFNSKRSLLATEINKKLALKTAAIDDFALDNQIFHSWKILAVYYQFKCFLVVWAMFSCQMFFQTYVWFENQRTQSALDGITGHNSMTFFFKIFTHNLVEKYWLYIKNLETKIVVWIMFSSQIFFQTYIRFENQRAQSLHLMASWGIIPWIFSNCSHTVEKSWLYIINLNVF